jgi:hypothetical protein
MALQPNFTFEQQCNCKEVLFNDTTGIYASPGNTGGYGPSNIESSDVTTARLEIKKSTWDYPILIDYTLNNDVIDDAVLTDQFGTTRNILSELSNTTFPFVNQVFDSILLYSTEQQDNLEVGTYFINYSVSDGTDIYFVEKWIFFVCQYNSCVEEAAVKLANRQITPATAQQIFLTYDLIYLNVGLQNVTSVQTQIEAMDQLCSECGCCS